MVRDIRHDELDALKKNAYIRAVSTFSWTIAPFFVSLATFISYTYSGNNLTPEKAFVALSLFNLLRFPLVMLPMLIASIVQAQVSMARVVKFLRRWAISVLLLEAFLVSMVYLERKVTRIMSNIFLSPAKTILTQPLFIFKMVSQK